MLRVASWLDFDSDLYRCGFRPFFLLASAYAALIFGLGERYGSIGKAEIWLTHEMVMGVGLCGLSGFLLTAFPAWTGTSRIESNKLGLLVVSWILARILVWSLPIIGEWPLVMANLLFFVLLLKYLAPSILEKKHRKHRIFYYQLCLLALVVCTGYYFWLLNDLAIALTLMNTGLGVLIVLLLTVLSRMSMVIVNHAIDRYEVPDVRHVAKPTRRNFAIAIILSYLCVNLLMEGGSIAGWLALASAAAVLNILNDWHLPKVWRDVYFQVGYSLYIFIAVGFTVIGLDAIGLYRVGLYETSLNDILVEPEHYVAINQALSGVMSVALLLIMLVVGQKHTGYKLSYSPIIKFMMILVLLPQFANLVDLLGLGLSLGKSGNVALMMSFVVYFITFQHPLMSSRIDGKDG